MSVWRSAGTAVPLDFGGPVDVEFNAFEEKWIARPIAERFDDIALRHADRLAVADGSMSLTYAELRRRAHHLAARIEAAAAARPVGILLPHDARIPVAAIACLLAGRPYVPIDLKFPAARIDAIIREAGLAAVIVDEMSVYTALVPPGIATIGIDGGEAQEYAAPASPGARLAVILYTSGSTGKPKGICNDQRAILQRVAEYTNSCHVNSDDRFILLSSPGTIAGQREIYTALLNGAELHITDPQLQGVHAVMETMARQRVTIGYAVPSLLRMLLRLPGADASFAHMRVLRVGGDVTLASDLALFRKVAPASCRFFASFSSTETPAVFQWFVPPEWQAAGPRVPIGYPRPDIDFAVIGEDGMPVAEGEIGELAVRSRYLALGQWQDGGLVPGSFLQDPEDPAARILHTGDMVRLQEGGLCELVGRKDRQVKLRGLRVDVGEVEAALRGCDGVMDVAVIARRTGEEVTALAAFVAPEGARESGLLDELKRALNARVPQYMHPADIRIVAGIPQLPGFKPDIAALERLDRQELERTASLPRTGHVASPRADVDPRIHAAVRYAWSAVLGAASFEADQRWDETAGDSLKAIELWFYIEEKLGFKLPLDALKEDATPDDLAAAIARHLAHDGTDVIRSDADDDSGPPVVFLFPGIQSDDPALARFRGALSGEVRFKTVDYPGWRQMAVAGAGFDAIVDAAYMMICGEPMCAVYRLAGYSFGGLVAVAVARRLLNSGRRIDFVGLLDARRWDLASSAQNQRFHSFLGERPSPLLDPVKQMIAGLVRRQQFDLLGLLERLAMWRPSKLSFWFRRQVTKEMRYQALQRWRPVPVDVPAVLFLSDERWPGEPADYGWSGIFRQLVKVHIGGTHATVLQSPQRELLCARFLEALQASRVPQAAAGGRRYS